jgi:hydrogenase nickel incorporation protein HypA/HybF
VSALHELGIVFHVVKTVTGIAEKNNLTKVDTIVLQIGELSTIVPKYIESCFPAAIDGTFMQETKLKIEILPGNVRCKNCGHVFNLIENKGYQCPECETEGGELISGKEFQIKEIIAC